MGCVNAVADPTALPQEDKSGNRGMAAQVYFTGRRKIPQCDAAIVFDADKYRFRMLELSCNLLHKRVTQPAVRQNHARLIAAENLRRKRIHDICFHSAPSFVPHYT